MDGFFNKYGRIIIIAVAICFVLLYLTPMRNVVGSSINGFAGNFANKVGESLGTVKMPDGSNNIKREPSSMLMKANGDRNDSSFNGKIPSSATKIMFTDEKAPKGVETVDLTAAQDGDVVGWLDGTTWKISTQDSKKSVTFNADSSYMFFDGGTGRIKEIQFNNIDTRQVESMDSLFVMCKGLTSLDLNGFDTHNVKNMNSMFQDCINLERLDLSGFDTSKVKNMIAMFYGCNKLNSVKVRSQTDIDNFKTKSIWISNNTKFEIK